jgi:hypothetical protein
VSDVPFWLAVVVLALLPRREPVMIVSPESRAAAAIYFAAEDRQRDLSRRAMAAGCVGMATRHTLTAELLHKTAIREATDPPLVIEPDVAVVARALCQDGKHELRAAPGGSECVNCPFRVGEAK